MIKGIFSVNGSLDFSELQ